MNSNILVYFCEVLSVIDDNAGLRIKVQIPYEDDDCKTINDLPYAFPALPKLIHINPKVGEFVFVFLQAQGEAKGNRLFLGPVISQQYYTNYDPYNYSARSLLKGKQIDKPLPNPAMNPENEGTLLDRDDVALIGRQNADLILKDNEVRMRCGFKKEPTGPPKNTLLFNKTDLSYIQMKYQQRRDQNNKEYSSSINIVADRINLLSHDSRTPFSLGDRKDLITDYEMSKILENAHPLVYGDVLVGFLKELIRIFQNHTHPFPMDPPCLTAPDVNTLTTDLNTFLSTSVRTN